MSTFNTTLFNSLTEMRCVFDIYLENWKFFFLMKVLFESGAQCLYLQMQADRLGWTLSRLLGKVSKRQNVFGTTFKFIQTADRKGQVS